MEIIYADSLFLFDLLTDYLLCLLTAKFCGLTPRRGRYLLAALIGAVYSVAVFLPGLGWLGTPVCRFAAAGIMGVAAFGREERLLRCIGAYLALSAACGGMLFMLGLDRGQVQMWALTLLFLCCYGLLSVMAKVRSRLSGSRFAEGQVCFRGREHPFRALIDTGNRLRDPVSGCRVLLLSPEVMQDSLGSLIHTEDPVEFLAAAGRDEALRGVFRLIPFTSVGGSGMLIAFSPERITAEGKELSGYIAALSPRARGDGFNAIF